MTATHPHARTIPALARTTAPIGLGCMGMSWAYTSVEGRDDDAAVAVIHAALDQGITLLDTSDVYGVGHNEELVGRALAGRRDEAILATKGGLVGSYEDGQARTARDARPEHLREAVDASLRRLGTDVIDLYYLHRVDPAVPLEESWGALAEIADAGKIRALGLSEVSVDQAELAHAIHPVAAVQSELSLWTRDPLGTGSTADGDPTGDLVSWTREHDAIMVPFSPLGRGFLTGSVDVNSLESTDMRRSLPRFADEAREANERIVHTVREVAARHDATPAAVALAWVLARGEHVIPIPGTTKTERLAQNLAAVDLALTDADLEALDAVPPAAGGRY